MSALMDYHGRIMNIERDQMLVASAPKDAAYFYGHRDARHAAAEIASEADVALAAKDAQIARLREALESVRQFGSDTLSGRIDGPDDRKWQRDAVAEMTRRANAAPAPVAEMRGAVNGAQIEEDFREGRGIDGKLLGMASRVAISYFGVDTRDNIADMLEVFAYWQRELGPALGLVEMREPSDDECHRMDVMMYSLSKRENTSYGRDMFDAVRAVMGTKGGES